MRTSRILFFFLVHKNPATNWIQFKKQYGILRFDINMDYEDLIPIWNVKGNSQIKHKGEKFPCMLCSNFHGYSSELKKHTKKEHNPKIIANQSTCSMCNWEGPPKKLNYHKNSCHGEVQKCENCGKIFMQLYQLTGHINEVHLGIKFPCD